MSIARRHQRNRAGNTAFGGHSARARGAIRKQGALCAAVTATATGAALVVPLGAPAHADLNPVTLRSLHLDSATVRKVQAYDKYRSREATQRKRAKKAVAFARKQIGKPYRWGGDGPHGYDCSGLAMAAWRKAGVDIPRVTYSQYRKVKRKVKLKDVKPGDLVFFHGRSHVGMYVGKSRFLHAPHSGAKVRIDKFGARRKKQFAGAVRPGAPVYKEWSPSVKELVEKIDRMEAQERRNPKPPDNQRTPHIPPPSATLTNFSDNPPTSPPAGALDAPPDGADPAPRPRSVAPQPRPGHGAGQAGDPAHQHHATPGFRPWAKYVSPYEELTAPGHISTV